MKPIGIGEHVVAITAAIVITTGIAGGLASLAVHQGGGRTDAAASFARAGIGCAPVLIAQPEAVAALQLARGG